MADKPPSPSDSSLDPTAATFTMPSSSSPSSSTSQPPATTTTKSTTEATTSITSNGQPKEPRPSSSKGKRPEPRPTESTTGSDVGAGAKLTGAQLKKQKAAEKAARRADKVAEKGAQAQAIGPPPGQQVGPVQARENQERVRRQSVGNRGGGEEMGSGHRRVGSTSVRLPVRAGGSGAGGGPGVVGANAGAQVSGVSGGKERSYDNKRVPMLSHLYPISSSLGVRKASLATADRQIHPAVLTLGLQLRDYVICGSNARTVATLLVFKKVIRSYDTPSGVALSRDLTRHLSHQINYLSQARQLCTAQGNSIRWLKKLITALDPDLADTEAKSFLCGAIDTFIREKITLADEVIATQAVGRIDDEGEVILTYGKSSVVEKTLLAAYETGKRFKVIVVDSRPLFEGKNLARSLIRAGLKDVQYCLLSGLADVVDQEGITKCFLGASAMLGNGRLFSRAGTAMTAMMAKEKENGGVQGQGKVPVIVLCESVKFTAKVALDSLLAMNEVVDADVLVLREEEETLTESIPAQTKQEPTKKGGRGGNNNNNDDEAEKKAKKGLEGWRDQQNLYLLSLMYDVTPTEYLDMVITELGTLPPDAVPVVNGVHGDDE